MILLAVAGAIFTILAAGLGATLLMMRGVARVNFLETAALSWLFGSGVISLLLWIGGYVLSGAALQLGVAATALALGFAGIQSARVRGVRLLLPKPRNSIEWLLALVIAAEFLVILHAGFSHGLGWDGLLNWEVKARYAFANGGVIPAAYYTSPTRAFTHPSYPLFIPLTELWFYLWMGEANQFWIKIIFPFFYGAGAVILAVTARRLTNLRWPGLVASALLFFVPCLSNSPGDAGGGYADFPLSVLYLSTFGYLLLHALTREAYALRLFAVSLALLPWMKREGAIMWLFAVLCGAVVLWRGRRSWSPLLWLLPGAILMLSWKIFLLRMQTTEAREFVAMSFTALHTNAARAWPICRMVLAEMMETTRWSLFWPGVAVACLCLLFRARDRGLFLLVAAVASPIALYAATYLFSSWPDYSQHVAASFPRLLLQVMPVAWLVIALALPWPQRAAAPIESPEQ